MRKRFGDVATCTCVAVAGDMMVVLLRSDEGGVVLPVRYAPDNGAWGAVRVADAAPSWKRAAANADAVVLLNDASQLALCPHGQQEAEVVQLPTGVWSSLAVDDDSIIVGGAGRRVLIVDVATRAIRELQGPAATSDSDHGILLGIAGTATDFVACGFGNELWRVRGEEWNRCPVAGALPLPLSTIARRDDDRWYVAGRAGLLLELSGVATRVIEWNHPDHPGKNLLQGLGDLWGVAWWRDQLYLSGLRGVVTVDPVSGEVGDVPFGESAPETSYGLASSHRFLAAWGAKDLVFCDGTAWKVAE